MINKTNSCKQIVSAPDHGARFLDDFLLHLGVVRESLQDVFPHIDRVHIPACLHVVKGQPESNCCVLFIAHLECLLVVDRGVHIALLLLFDQPHKLLRLRHRLVVFQTLIQLLLCQVIFIVGDEEVCQEQVAFLIVISILQLIFILEKCLEVVSGISLFLEHELAECHVVEGRDVLLVLGEDVLEPLHTGLQPIFRLRMDQLGNVEKCDVHASLRQFSNQVPSCFEVVRGAGVFLVPGGGVDHLVEGVEVDIDHVGDGRLPKEPIEPSHIKFLQRVHWVTHVPVVHALHEGQTRHRRPLCGFLSRLKVLRNLTKPPSPPHEFNQLVQSVEVVRLLLQEPLVRIDRLITPPIMEHEVG
mmetsp:Transcript_40518/g.39030  ORF Transcript_40518/g.39030 Transcript_40518/m.39030 type:complete len:357 (-) Transcript_40518:2918-3988(-)